MINANFHLFFSKGNEIKSIPKDIVQAINHSGLL
jgi:hypothetical protein